MQRSACVAGRSRAANLAPKGVAFVTPSARALNLQQHRSKHVSYSAAEAAAPAAVVDAPQSKAPAEKPEPAAAEPTNGGRSNKKSPDQRKGGKTRKDANGSSSASGTDRVVIQERCRLLLKGDAVGLSMSPTAADIATGFKGLRPLSQELRRENQTLLFFPSNRQQQQEEQPATAADASVRKPKQPPTRVLDLAMVAVPKFQAPAPEVTIRVGAKSDPSVISRTLTRALMRSSSVAVHAAGPAAALVAVQSSVLARRSLGSSQQLDLAFSIEYLKLPASVAASAAKVNAAPVAAAEAAPVAASEAASEAGAVPASEAPASPAAPADTASAGSAPDAEASTVMASVMQFSFYKRALQTPEVLVSDFAPSRASQPMTTLLTSLMAERREVELVLHSRDALFAVQSLSRVVRDCWIRSKASVGIFLTSLEPSPEDPEHFTARLQLRRIPGAPNFVAASGGGSSRQSLLGAPLGDVKRDTPISSLAAAMSRELDSAGVYSVLPQEGVCVARVLRSLWQAQGQRTAAYRADGAPAPPAPPPAADSSAADAPASSLLQIAIVPETQTEGGTFSPVEAPGTATPTSDDEDAPPEVAERGRRGPLRERPARATVLHLVEVNPVLASTLRQQEGGQVAISGGEQLAQLTKAVVLRNRMYGSRRDAKVLVMRPMLDEAGSLVVRLEYVNAAGLADLPQPPPPTPRGGGATAAAVTAAAAAAAAAAASSAGSNTAAANSAKAAARLFSAPPPPMGDFVGYATDDEYGLGAEAAVLMPMPALAAAAAAEEEEERRRHAGRAAPGSAPAATGKAPWVLFVNGRTSSLNLAMAVVAETCKPWDRMSPAWLRVLPRADAISTAGLAVAMAQAQVQERSNVGLLVLPVLERKRDERNRPFNALTWRLVKSGPGAEAGAAAAAAAVQRIEAPMAERKGRGSRPKKARETEQVGPSPAAMAAAAAAAAKAKADGDAMMGGTRKLW